MKTKDTLLIYVDVMERYHFFKRFINPLKELGYEVLIVTGRLSIYLLSKNFAVKVLLLKNIEVKDWTKCHLDDSLSVLNAYHSFDEACTIYNNVLQQLNSSGLNIDAVFIWNGTTTIARAISDFAIDHDIKRYYFEISNLGSKVFVDKEGVNAKSYLSKHPEILDNVNPNDACFDKWREEWYRNYTMPKQSKNSTKVPYSFFIDLIGFIFFNALREDRRSAFSILTKKIFLKQKSKKVKYENALPERYIFLAMQVSDDSQIKLNSDISNLEALKIALKMAQKKGVPLVVKLHPAEADLDFIEKVFTLSRNDSFMITDLPGNHLIENAEEVVVINSTIGLEALILEKKVTILGRAFYKNFDIQRIKSYICHYLVDIDYFDRKEKLSWQVVQKVLNKV